uniref:Uncharacterized protein n=1 Tax=uncultured Chromatiales bacterium HF0200_41F04 TaxID=710740 RepID=E0XV13_9GAMM|nr:hypothetical protein [uncultured Chromatiales bacterium HF0200_41F04]
MRRDIRDVDKSGFRGFGCVTCRFRLCLLVLSLCVALEIAGREVRVNLASCHITRI